jgi:hypothetical protein
MNSIDPVMGWPKFLRTTSKRVNMIIHANTPPAITYNDLSILAITATKRFIFCLPVYVKTSPNPISLKMKKQRGLGIPALFYAYKS